MKNRVIISINYINFRSLYHSKEELGNLDMRKVKSKRVYISVILSILNDDRSSKDSKKIKYIRQVHKKFQLSLKNLR